VESVESADKRLYADGVGEVEDDEMRRVASDRECACWDEELRGRGMRVGMDKGLWNRVDGWDGMD
jgi:hypothetical protein